MKHWPKAVLLSRACWKRNCKCGEFVCIVLYIADVHCNFFHRNLVRNSRQSQLKSVDNSPTDTQYIGKQGKDFEFSHLPQKIDVAECSAKECELEAVAQWIEQLL